MPPRTKPVTLADLSVEDRKALLSQAREESKTNPTDVDGYAELTEREQAIRRLMDARDHQRGCPVQEGVDLGRVEGYEARKPPRPDLGLPAVNLGVIRCVECGGSTVLEDRLEPAIEGALSELAGIGVGGPDDEAEL